MDATYLLRNCRRVLNGAEVELEECDARRVNDVAATVNLVAVKIQREGEPSVRVV